LHLAAVAHREFPNSKTAAAPRPAAPGLFNVAIRQRTPANASQDCTLPSGVADESLRVSLTRTPT